MDNYNLQQAKEYNESYYVLLKKLKRNLSENLQDQRNGIEKFYGKFFGRQKGVGMKFQSKLEVSQGKPSVIIYGRESCPWCVKAKEFANDNKCTVEFFSFDDIPDWKSHMKNNKKIKGSCEEAQNQNTIPIIFVNGKYIEGGYTGLEKNLRKL